MIFLIFLFAVFLLLLSFCFSFLFNFFVGIDQASRIDLKQTSSFFESIHVHNQKRGITRNDSHDDRYFRILNVRPRARVPATHRERERQRQRETERETDRETDRETERQRQRQSEQNRTFPDSMNLLVTPVVHAPVFRGFPACLHLA